MLSFLQCTDPWDPLSSIDPVSIQVPKQADCDMCRFSRQSLLFSCQGDSDSTDEVGHLPVLHFAFHRGLRFSLVVWYEPHGTRSLGYFQ